MYALTIPSCTADALEGLAVTCGLALTLFDLKTLASVAAESLLLTVERGPIINLHHFIRQLEE